MVASPTELSGRAYLAAVTELLQRAHLAGRHRGLWDAADFQWSWRKDQHPDPRDQRFWFDADGPVGAVVITDWGDAIGCDLLTTPGGPDLVDDLLPPALERLADRSGRTVETAVHDDDEPLRAALADVGFTATGERAMGTEMPAGERPTAVALPDGFRISSRAERVDRPHHMIARNGEHVAVRLAECSLYRPDLDLVVLDPTGAVAAYALFWADPVTGVGLLEPMRTEDAFQGRGLGRALVAAGLERLAGAGCTTLKVTYLLDNPAAERLYVGAGFHRRVPSTTFRRPPA